jgi:hypothetical protein
MIKGILAILLLGLTATAALLVGPLLTFAAPSRKPAGPPLNTTVSQPVSSAAFNTLQFSPADFLSEWNDDNWCGTTRDGAQKALEEHQRRQALMPQRRERFSLSATGNVDVGNIAVIEDDGFILADLGQGLQLDGVQACKRFYQTHPDSFDILAIYTTSDLYFGAAFAYQVNVKNEVAGIHIGIFDFTSYYGSSGRLRSYLGMNSVNVYPPSPQSRFLRTNHHLSILGHEAEHRWGARVRFDSAQGSSVVGSPELLLCDAVHWGFYTDARSQFFNTASCLEGNLWQDNGGGSFTTETVTDNYMRLDQYLMGLRPANSVDSLWFIRNPSPSTFNCTRASDTPVTVDGTKTWVKIEDIVAVEGPRVPDASAAEKDFRMAFILVVPNGVRPTAYELARLDSARTQWAGYFNTATEGLGTMNTELFPPGPLAIVSDTLAKGAMGGNYRDQVFAVGGHLPYFSYVLTAGSLPPGLFLNTGTGVISGIPTAPGGYDFTIEVCDSLGNCTSRPLHIEIFVTGAATVVINEVELFTRGGSVELYNKGSQAQDIGNWTVETRTLSSVATLTVPSGTIIPPGAYYVLNEYAGISTANYLYVNTPIPWTNAASGSCALIDHLGNGVDFCRWGTSAQPPPPGTGWNGVNPSAPVGSRNIGRDGLSIDTDNSSDFTSQPGTLGRQNLPYSSLLQTTTASTPVIQALITNWNNIAARGTFPTLSYIDDGTSFLLDASFFAGVLKPNGDPMVYRGFFSDQQFIPTAPLSIDNVSDPRATHIRSTSVTFDSVLSIQAHYILPKLADSGQFIIGQFRAENLSNDTLKGILLGMVADYNVPPQPNANSSGGTYLEYQNNFAGLAALGVSWFHAVQAVDNTTYVHPYDGYLTGQLYQIANGTPVPVSEPNNLNLVMTHTKLPALQPGGCAASSFAMILSRSGLPNFLTSNGKARAFLGGMFPRPPSGLQAVGTCQRTIHLSFSLPPDPDFQYFKIHRHSPGDSGNPIVIGTTTDTFFVDTVPPPGLFNYWVSVVDTSCNEGAVSTQTNARAGIKGDLNADAALSPADVVLELNAVFLADSFTAPFCSADLNCDGNLSSADVVLELNLVFLSDPVTCIP